MQYRFIFPEFHLCPTIWTPYIKYIPWFPVPLILTRTTRFIHDKSLNDEL
jgi:hypothetical protein